MSHSTSIVPVVLWGKTPPSHLIKVVTCTYDQKTVITGSSDGQIGLWDLRHTKDNGIKVVPRNLIFAHGGEILDIACALDASFDRPNIISLAANGEICLWDIEDGLCLQLKVIPGNHKKLQSVQVTKGSVREWRILLYGLYSDIYVLDTSSLEILYTLKSKLSPDWITCLCTLRQTRHQEEKLVALTASNCLKVWKLKASYERRNPEVVFEQESKILDCWKAKSMCCNPFTQRTVLVISAKAWQIFDSSDYSFIASIPSPYKQALSGGDFVAANRVIIWDKTGTAYLYRLPSRYLHGSEGIDQSNTDKSRAPVLVCLFETRNLKVNFGAPMYFSYGRRGPFYKLLFQGTSRGCLHVWKVPDSEQADQLLCKGLVSASELAKSEATVLNEGIRMTIMTDERLMMRVIPHIAFMSLTELWKQAQPRGLIEELAGDSSVIPVTASLYLPSQGLIVCGRKDGTIVVISAIKSALMQLLKPNNITKTGCLPLNILKGHSGKVTCLLYPNEENPRYDLSHLVSGSSDFTVRLWDVFNGTLLHTFNSHGGEVLKLLVTPQNCTARFLSCICSVAQDHSVAILGIRERKTLLLASRHTFPVETIRWRAKDDFMVIGCADGTVYVWQMETGHLDRCVAGSVAFDILQSCQEETSSPSPAVREYRLKFRLQSLSSVTQQLPIDFHTPAIVKKVKKKITNIQQQVTGLQKSPSSQQIDYLRQATSTVQFPPIRVCSLRANQNDSNIHVMLLDSEALICQLLTEEAEAAARDGKPVNPKRHPSIGQQTISPEQKKNKTPLSTQVQREVSHEIAQLLLSCIHAWGIDASLDKTCIEKLGMMKPRLPVSFGLLTRGKLSLMLPGWQICTQEEVPDEDAQEQQIKAEDDQSLCQKLLFNSHWQLSSSLTTQHLVSIVSITNTLMSMNHVSFVAQNTIDKDDYDQAYMHDFGQFSQNRAEEKAGWSLVAALHCCLLPEMMRGLMYRPPLLHILARRWQDRCLEIREAAQAILLAELRRVGTKGRKQLIDAWSPHLPQDTDSTDFGFEDLEQYMNNEEEKPVVLTADEDRTDLTMVMLTSKKMVSSDIKLRHATAIVMLGVIGAEFQKEVDPLLVSKDKKGLPTTDSAMDMTTLRSTAMALTSLLLQRATSKAPAYSAIRRAAVDLIGRGFALWEPHIDVSHVLMGLLDLSANTELKNIQNAETEIGKTILSAPADLHRSARHALSLIATARPAAYITTLAKEVARHVASTSSMSFNQTSPAAIAVYSHVRYQPTSSTPDTQNSNIIHSARNEILRTIELMIDKSQQDVVHLIVEVVDIVVHCLDHKIVKDKGLGEVFPAICRFNMVSYCSNTRRLAVGSRLGHIALYDLRSSRCQLIPAHTSPVTALAFSPEGKVLASFSHEDAKLSFWQTSTSLLGMLSSTVKCVHSYSTPDLKKYGSAALKQIRLVWISHKNVVILTGDNREFKFSV